MYLLDTNVVSETRKVRAGRANPHVTAWLLAIPESSLFLSAVVIQELEIGVLLTERRDPAQGALLRAWVDKHVLPGFAGRILPVDSVIAQRSAALHVPNPRPYRDSFIAATALVHGMTVVTRNLGDFRAAGVSLLNPWDHSTR